MCSSQGSRSAGLTFHDKGLTGYSLLILLAVSLIIFATGCATPKLQPADPQLLFKSELLSFLKDGVTTREDAVFKLGIPSAQIEGDRILMYQLTVDKDGKWGLIAPRWNAGAGLRSWSGGTCSLVLIFEGNGILRKHSLVTAQ